MTLEQELMKKYKDTNFDDDINKLIELLHRFLSLVPKTANYSLIKPEKKDLLYFLYGKCIDYSNQSFLNLILGNYELYCAGLRIIIENYVIIANIVDSDDNKWIKFYFRSFSSTIGFLKKEQRIDLRNLIDSFRELKNEYGFSDLTFSEKKFDYDWLSTSKLSINSFKDACLLIDSSIYKDFELLSNYSHSNSFAFKIYKNPDSLINYIFIHYFYLSKLIYLLKLDVSKKYENADNKLFNYICYLNRKNPYNN